MILTFSRSVAKCWVDTSSISKSTDANETKCQQKSYKMCLLSGLWNKINLLNIKCFGTMHFIYYLINQ